MISIKNFGWRLGNQLFQLSTAISLAEDNMDTVAFPEWKYSQHFKHDFSPAVDEIEFTHTQNGFHYTPIKYHQNMAIDGYFQSEKYFVNNKSIIKKTFEFKSILKLDEQDVCGVHVRRGDYLNYPNHHPTKDISNYYGEAMDVISKMLGTKPKFLIFSDDIEWCKKEFGDECLYSENRTEIEDIQLMTQCKYMIIANSSYSWWGAWLGNPEIVIAPRDWFGDAYAFWNTSDLIPSRWILA